ncbi:MAG: hypothetical protein QOJ35_943 [Solirubrobacteraceae bacterium]|nr:hypothetical protein [Solirubrobacteraceae bacterium]
MIGVLVVAMLALMGTRMAVAGVRMLRTARTGERRDRATVVLLLAVGGLPADRADWGKAMLCELGHVQGSRARTRFSLGCVDAVVRLRVRESLGGSHRDGVVVRAVVLGAVAGAGGLGGYGLIRYPLLRSGDGAWAGVLALLAVLLGYAVCALCLSRGTTPRAIVARRYGLFGGLALGAAWLVVIFPTAALKQWVAAPLVLVMLGPMGVAALARRTSRDAKAATAAAMWCGLVGGLVVFVIWVTATYLHGGRPFDPQLIRDFRASGARDLTAYAVGDNFGAALGMLVMIPTLALAAGSLAARGTADAGRECMSGGPRNGVM